MVQNGIVICKLPLEISWNLIGWAISEYLESQGGEFGTKPNGDNSAPEHFVSTDLGQLDSQLVSGKSQTKLTRFFTQFGWIRLDLANSSPSQFSWFKSDSLRFGWFKHFSVNSYPVWSGSRIFQPIYSHIGKSRYSSAMFPPYSAHFVSVSRLDWWFVCWLYFLVVGFEFGCRFCVLVFGRCDGDNIQYNLSS